MVDFLQSKVYGYMIWLPESAMAIIWMEVILFNLGKSGFEKPIKINSRDGRVIMSSVVSMSLSRKRLKILWPFFSRISFEEMFYGPNRGISKFTISIGISY